MHISIPVENTVELLNFTPFNPLISKCEIKVCYVGEAPNRNGSVITKSVAADMAKTLPGCPIVGFYNQATGDFEEHNRTIDVSNGKFRVIDTTRPYGFVDKNAKVWFQKFNDDGVEHEYLMTEGWIWTGVYPESQRVIDRGNNQSMELNEKIKGKWTTNDNGMPEFFIINEAIIQKLCILGENVEPCFEGAGIAAQFSFDDEFKNTMYSMIEELQTALQEGGIIQMDEEEKVDLTEEVEFKKKDEEDEEKNPPAPEKKDNDDSEDKSDSDDSEKDEEEKKKLNHSASDKDDDKPKAECTCEEDDKKKYSLTDIPEYVELQNNYSALEQKYNDLVAEITPLREFKAAADKREKQAMIDSFYMLSDTDKADVIANIDTYSVNDIEAKLAIICVRNKVNFNLEDDKKDEESNPLIYSLGNDTDGDSAPAWIKAVRETAKNM